MDSESSAAGPVYWRGTAEFFDGKRAKAVETPVAIGPGGLDIQEGEAAGRYLRGDFSLEEGSGDGGFFGLRLKGREDALLAFHGRPEALEWLRASGLLKRPAGAGISTGNKALALIGFLAAFSAFTYFIGLDLAVNAVVRILPPGIDRVLGGPVARAFDSRIVQPDDSAAARALAKSRDLVGSLRPGYRDSVRILIVRDTALKNAFAFPGGTIVVFTGMLRMLEGQDEWLGLLAHEGAHLHLRHGTRRLVRSGLLGIYSALIFGDVSGAGSVLADNAGMLMNLSYGRRDESEADAFALSTLKEKGYPAGGLASLFRKFLRFRGMPDWAAFLSTHPATQERIQALEGAGSASGGGLLSAEEWAALKAL